jgi:hypothetical protein
MSKQQTSLSSKTYETSLMKIRGAFGNWNSMFGSQYFGFGKWYSTFSDYSGFGNGLSTFGNGYSTFGNGLSTFGNGYSTFGNGLSTFGNGRSTFGNGLSTFGNGLSTFGNGRSTFGAGLSTFGNGLSSFGAGCSGFGLSGKSLQNKGKATPRKTGQTSRDKLSDHLETTIEQDFQACEALLQDGTGRNEWIEQNCRRQRLWREGAEAGDPRAQVLYGLCFYYGHGEQEDDEAAENWFRRAAEQGNAQAQMSLGQLIYNLDNQETEAVEWLHKSAATGCSWSQYLLGQAYQWGHGVESDDAESERWYRLAAEQGHQEAAESIAEWAKYDVLTVDKANQMVNDYLANHKEESGVVEDEENEFNWHNMNDFRQIDEAAAEILAACKGDLDLSGLESLTLSVASTFSDEPWEGTEESWHTVDLDLSGLTKIGTDVVKVLTSRFVGMPAFCGVQGDLLLNGFQELSVEQARLFGTYRGPLSLDGLESISDEALEALSQHEQNLSLSGIKSLSAKAANALGNHKGDWLNLNGLTELSPAAAQALGACKADSLELDGLKSLSSKAAENLLRRRGEDDYRSISLDGLTTLSEPVARSRVGFLQEHDSIYLPNLEDLAPDVAQVLASGTHYLTFPGLKQITNEVAEILANQQGESLSLDGLSELSDEAAYLLSKYQGSLSFDGITELSDVAAEHLGEHRGDLSLYGLQSLSETAARHLSTRQGALTMELDETELSGSVADILRSHPSLLNVEEGTSVSIPEQIKAKLEELNITSFGAEYDGSGDDGESQYSIDGPEGNLVPTDYYHGDGLGEALHEALENSSITLETCVQLCETVVSMIWSVLPGGWEIETGSYGTVSIDVEADQITVDHVWRDGDDEDENTGQQVEQKLLTREFAEQFMGDEDSVDLSEFTMLDDDAAEILSGHDGTLNLERLASLSDATASSLGRHDGVLYLEGITSLSDEAASGLANHTASELHLDNCQFSQTPSNISLQIAVCGPELSQLTDLSQEVAKIVAQIESEHVDLSGLTTVSPEAAVELCGYTGVLGLEGVTTISDRTAQILSQYKGKSLCLGIEELSDQAAELLSRTDCDLQLHSLSELGDSAGHLALTKKLTTQNELVLSGLERLSDAAAMILKDYGGALEISLSDISESVARSMSQCSALNPESTYFDFEEQAGEGYDQLSEALANAARWGVFCFATEQPADSKEDDEEEDD